MSSTATGAERPPIVLIHGMWMTPRSWEPWVERYSTRGHHVLAPGWPGVGPDPDDVRRNPSPLEGLGIAAIVDHYETIVRGLDRPPIIVGHSFGGLFTQLLLDRGLGAAGVALGSAPPKGVLLLPYSSLRAAWPALRNPLKRNGLAPLTREQFHWAFTNTLTKEASDAVYERQYIPGTSRAFFEAALANLNPHSPAKIDFGNPSRAPLLLVVGGKDRISPPSVNRTLLKLQRRAPSVTESKEFPARSHYTAGEDGWEEVADYVLDWALRHARSDVGETKGVRELARSYTDAWCSHDPARVAEHYVPGGTIRINGGAATEITEVARSFISAFPDIELVMDDLVFRGDVVEYHWTFTGTNTGPGGTGKRVRISGFEEWTLGADGLVAEAKGHFDEAEYERQLEHGAPGGAY